MTTGMVIMRPTSIVVAGGGTETASIRAAGGVEFANATSLSLNGVFTSDYDDYMIGMRFTGTAVVALWYRNRLSGSDATGTDYASQALNANNTTVSAVRDTSQSYYRIGSSNSTLRSGITCFVYGSSLAQPTAFRAVSVEGYNNGRIYDLAGTHSLSTAYDGFTIYPNSGSITGLITVYGLAQ